MAAPGPAIASTLVLPLLPLHVINVILTITINYY